MFMTLGNIYVIGQVKNSIDYPNDEAGDIFYVFIVNQSPLASLIDSTN